MSGKDCQNENPVMILVERLREASTIVPATGRPRAPYEYENSPCWQAADALLSLSGALEIQGAELTRALEYHKEQAASLLSLQGRVEELESNQRLVIKEVVAWRTAFPDCGFVHPDRIVLIPDPDAPFTSLHELPDVLSLSQERDRLREALEPFADFDKIWPQAVGYWEFTVDAFAEGADRTADFTGDDLRRARAALHKDQSQ